MDGWMEFLFNKSSNKFYMGFQYNRTGMSKHVKLSTGRLGVDLPKPTTITMVSIIYYDNFGW